MRGKRKNKIKRRGKEGKETLRDGEKRGGKEGKKMRI